VRNALGKGKPTKPTSLCQNDLASALAGFLGAPIKKTALNTAYLYAAQQKAGKYSCHTDMREDEEREPEPPAAPPPPPPLGPDREVERGLPPSREERPSREREERRESE
jgi:hypothetical protein